MPPVSQANPCYRALAPAVKAPVAPTKQWYRHEPYYYPVLELPQAPGMDCRCRSPFKAYCAALDAKVGADSIDVLWFIPEAGEVFRGVERLEPAGGETAVLSDVSAGVLRGTWPFQPAHRPVTVSAARTARCVKTFRSRPSGADVAASLHRLFAGGMRSQKALQHRYLAILSELSGVDLLDVECTKNAVRFSVVGAEAAERVLQLSHRLRCVGDSVVFALRDDVDLNRIDVTHATMLAGHAAPIERSSKHQPVLDSENGPVLRNQ